MKKVNYMPVIISICFLTSALIVLGLLAYDDGKPINAGVMFSAALILLMVNVILAVHEALEDEKFEDAQPKSRPKTAQQSQDRREMLKKLQEL